MLGKAIGNLAKSVGIGIRVSLTLAVVVSTVARVTSVTVVDTSDHTNVVGMACGVGIMLRKTVSNLSEGVSLRLSLGVSLSLTLSVVVSSISSIADVSSRVT